MAEDDWDGWAALTRAPGSTVQLVGRPVRDQRRSGPRHRLRRGCNAILIKVNQIDAH
jgi:enolase